MPVNKLFSADVNEEFHKEITANKECYSSEFFLGESVLSTTSSFFFKKINL